MILSCLLEAVDRSCSSINIGSGFESSGIVPVNIEKPLSSTYAMTNHENQTIYNTNPRENIINNHFLNQNKNVITKLFMAETGREPLPEELDTDISKIRDLVSSFHRNSVDHDKLLSKIPDFLIEDFSNIMRNKIEADEVVRYRC